MKSKNILLLLCLIAGQNLKAAAAASVEERDAVVVEVDNDRALQALVSPVPAVDLAEPTATSDEINREVAREFRERQNAMQRFGMGQDGLFWRTAHKVRSGVSLAGHVVKYPTVALCGVAAPLYWYVKDEFCAPVKSFIRENFTLVAGVIAAGGVGFGLYYGPKDHAVTEGYKGLKDEVADHREVTRSLAEKYLIERKKKEKLEQLNGVIAVAGAALQELAQQTADTKKALKTAGDELAGVKNETARVVRQQQETRVAEFVKFVQAAIQAEGAQFKELKAIQANPATAQDASLLQVTLSTVGGARLCQEVLAQMYRTAIGQGLPADLQALLEELMMNIAPHLQNLQTNRLRVNELCLELQTQHADALAADARRMAALVAAAERAALPAPTATVPGVRSVAPATMAMFNSFGPRTAVSLGSFGGMLLPPPARAQSAVAVPVLESTENTTGGSTPSAGAATGTSDKKDAEVD